MKAELLPIIRVQIEGVKASIANAFHGYEEALKPEIDKAIEQALVRVGKAINTYAEDIVREEMEKRVRSIVYDIIHTHYGEHLRKLIKDLLNE